MISFVNGNDLLIKHKRTKKCWDFKDLKSVEYDRFINDVRVALEEYPRLPYIDVEKYCKHDEEAMIVAYGQMYKRGIKRVIFNPPATIVFWNDGTKTVVKAVNEPYDWEKGIAMAYVKKMCGNQGNYYNIFRKYEEAGLKAQGNPQEGEVEEIRYNFNKSYTKKRNDPNTISPRNIAADIVERFEYLLDKHNINIPDDDRNADPNAASIYGVTYDTLLSEVEDIVTSALKTMKANPDLNIAEGVFY